MRILKNNSNIQWSKLQKAIREVCDLVSNDNDSRVEKEFDRRDMKGAIHKRQPASSKDNLFGITPRPPGRSM